MDTLPSPIQFIEDLLSNLSTCTTPDPTTRQGQDGPPLSALSPQIKPLMFTLHCLFPNELLLALDILDRRLVRRLRLQDDDRVNLPESEGQDLGLDLFYVISASAPPHSPGQTLGLDSLAKGYEVRLHAWNCTCPSFALAAFRGLGSDEECSGSGSESDSAPAKTAYVFGGSLTRGATRNAPPACKHLLACLLLVRCPGLVPVEDGCCVRVSRALAAGVCAGFGG